MTTKEINCVIIGLGKVGLGQHIPAMLNVGNFKLAGCVTRNQERYLQAKEKFPDAKWYKDLKELLNDGQAANFAIVCTPSDLHYDESVLLLKKGYDLLIEKPVTLNAKEAASIKKLAVKLKRRIFVFQNREYDSDFNFIRGIISSGKLGRVFQLEIHMFSSFGPSWGYYGMTEWRINGKAGGMLYDWGPHMFEQVIKLFPEGIDNVYAKLQMKGNFKIVDDHSFIQFITKENNQIFIFLSNHCPAMFPHWLIIGDKASLRSDYIDYWNWTGFTLFKPDDKNNIMTESLKAPQKDGLGVDSSFYKDLYDELSGKEGSLKVNYDDAVYVMKLIDAAFLSNKLGRPVKVV